MYSNGTDKKYLQDTFKTYLVQQCQFLIYTLVDSLRLTDIAYGVSEVAADWFADNGVVSAACHAL